MAGRLLVFILMYSFHKIQAQDLLQPKLTVSPAVITETDSVVLNCQTPSSVFVSECHFRFTRGPAQTFSCLETLTATELLKMSHQSSPAEVEVICFYIVKSGPTYTASPPSETFSITIKTLPPPKLTANPAVITETDSVTLNCQTPSSVSVYQCFFYTVSGKHVRGFSCLRTLTGTELLLISSQSSPAEVKVRCFYTVKIGQANSPSPRSETSIIIQSQKPQMTVHHEDDPVIFMCSLPGSASHDTKCNLYFGEDSRPVQTTTIRWKTKKNQRTCEFYVTLDDLLSRLRSVQQHDASCDYSSGSEPNSLSPRSDGRSLTDIVEKEMRVAPTQSAFTTTKDLTDILTEVTKTEAPGLTPPISDVVEHSTQTKSTMPASDMAEVDSHTTQTKSTSTMISGQTVSSPCVSTPVTPAKQTSEMMISMIGAGVTVGVILIGLTLLFTQSRTEKCVSKRPKANITGKSKAGSESMGVYDETYSIIIYE